MSRDDISIAVAGLALVTFLLNLLQQGRMWDQQGRIWDSLRSEIRSSSERLDDLRSHMDVRFNSLDQRLTDMQQMWRSELRRVEDVYDARLKHVEDK